MTQETEANKEAATKSRRDFVKTTGRLAVTAPAVAVLLNASMKKAYASTTYLLHSNVDDPNRGEDVDAINTGSNTNLFNGGPQQDDRV